MAAENRRRGRLAALAQAGAVRSPATLLTLASGVHHQVAAAITAERALRPVPREPRVLRPGRAVRPEMAAVADGKVAAARRAWSVGKAATQEVRSSH